MPKFEITKGDLLGVDFKREVEIAAFNQSIRDIQEIEDARFLASIEEHNMSMEKRAVVETEQEKKAYEQVKKDLTRKVDTTPPPPKKEEK